MKEDYLWDKRGTPDPEIEKLENALQIFRRQHDAPPALPAPVISLAKNPKSKLRRFHAAISLAAAAYLFIAVFLGFWLRSWPERWQAGKNSPQTTAKQSAPMPPIAPNQNRETARITKKTKRAAQQSVQRALANQYLDNSSAKLSDKKSNPRPLSPSRSQRCCQPKSAGFAKNIRRAKSSSPDAALLGELKPDELYAYRQLMRALQITSSKLDLVRKKVRGRSDKTNLSLSITRS